MTKFWTQIGTDKLATTELSFICPALDEKLEKSLHDLFMSAWLGDTRFDGTEIKGAYSDVSNEQLKLAPTTTKRSFISDTIKEEVEDWKNDPSIKYLCIYAYDHLVGFGSMDQTEFNKTRKRNEIYFRQFAIKSPFQGLGIGKALVDEYKAMQKFPEHDTSILVTRKVNLRSLQYYKKAGFKINEALTHGQYNPEVYVGMDRPLTTPRRKSFCR